MRDKISLSCGKGNTRYFNLSIIGWATVCPYARDLLIHGTIPVKYYYPTAEELKETHDLLKSGILGALFVIKNSSNMNIASIYQEYEQEIGLKIKHTKVCARSKADIYVILIRNRLGIVNVYIEAATRISKVKKNVVILRGIWFFYKTFRPVILIIVSPKIILYKILNNNDQNRLIRNLNSSPVGFNPSPELCSICDFSSFCPYRVI